MTSLPVDWSAFYSQLHGFVASRVRPASDVDDLAHVILERAMSKAAEAEVDNAAGWLFGIARNAIADHYRSQARSLVAAADAIEAVDDPLGDSDVERAMVIACMEPLLNTLPDDVAQLLRWVDMQGRSMQAIAAELGISLTAAKSRVSEHARISSRPPASAAPSQSTRAVASPISPLEIPPKRSSARRALPIPI